MNTATRETKGAKPEIKNAKKPERRLPDLTVKKDVRGGAGDIGIIKTTDKGSAK